MDEQNDQQLARQVIRQRRRLPRTADRQNVLLLSSSLHKNLIYTLRSPSASLLIFVCVRAHCIVTDQYHYATQRNDTVSPLQSPHSTVSLLSLFLSSPLHTRPRPVSSSIYSWTQQCCPVSAQQRGNHSQRDGAREAWNSLNETNAIPWA